VKELPSIKILFLRHVGPYSQVGATWGRLMSWAGMGGLLGPQTRMLGIVHDDPDVTPADKVRYDAAVRGQWIGFLASDFCFSPNSVGF
jgi:AraC family transcriptional regulator